MSCVNHGCVNMNFQKCVHSLQMFHFEKLSQFQIILRESCFKFLQLFYYNL